MELLHALMINHQELAVSMHLFSQVTDISKSLDVNDKNTLPADGLAITEKIIATNVSSKEKLLATVSGLPGTSALSEA
jgi:hypothetical protein